MARPALFGYNVVRLLRFVKALQFLFLDRNRLGEGLERELQIRQIYFLFGHESGFIFFVVRADLLIGNVIGLEALPWHTKLGIGSSLAQQSIQIFQVPFPDDGGAIYRRENLCA